jgi:hypothetical protein
MQLEVTLIVIIKIARYWGRDHGNNEEFQMIDKRTAAGVYPGGKFDGNNFSHLWSSCIVFRSKDAHPSSSIDFTC